jgi:hypothetical protein
MHRCHVVALRLHGLHVFCQSTNRFRRRSNSKHLMAVAPLAAHLDISMQDLILARMALMQSAGQLEEDTPYLVLLHLLAGALVFPDYGSKVSVFAKLHNYVDSCRLTVNDAVLARYNTLTSSMRTI